MEVGVKVTSAQFEWVKIKNLKLGINPNLFTRRLNWLRVQLTIYTTRDIWKFFKIARPSAGDKNISRSVYH